MLYQGSVVRSVASEAQRDSGTESGSITLAPKPAPGDGSPWPSLESGTPDKCLFWETDRWANIRCPAAPPHAWGCLVAVYVGRH